MGKLVHSLPNFRKEVEVLFSVLSARPFVLITGTVIGLLLLIGGSVALLYSIGDQELPSTLLGGIAGSVRKE